MQDWCQKLPNDRDVAYQLDWISELAQHYHETFAVKLNLPAVFRAFHEIQRAIFLGECYSRRNKALPMKRRVSLVFVCKCGGYFIYGSKVPANSKN